MSVRESNESDARIEQAATYLEVHTGPLIVELADALLAEAVEDLGRVDQSLVVATGKVALDLLKISASWEVDLQSTWSKVIEVLETPSLKEIRVIELLKFAVEISKIQTDLGTSVVDYLKSNHFDLLMVNVPERAKLRSDATLYKHLFPSRRFGRDGLHNLTRGASPEFLHFN